MNHNSIYINEFFMAHMHFSWALFPARKQMSYHYVLTKFGQKRQGRLNVVFHRKVLLFVSSGAQVHESVKQDHPHQTEIRGLNRASSKNGDDDHPCTPQKEN